MLMFHYLLLLLKSASYHFARLLRSVDRTTRTVNNEKKKKQRYIPALNWRNISFSCNKSGKLSFKCEIHQFTSPHSRFFFKIVLNVFQLSVNYARRLATDKSPSIPSVVLTNSYKCKHGKKKNHEKTITIAFLSVHFSVWNSSCIIEVYLEF